MADRFGTAIYTYCRRGQGHLCVQFACTGLSAETGWMAELAVVKEYQVARLPDEVSDLEGAVVEPAAVAAYGVERAGVTGGDVVLVRERRAVIAGPEVRASHTVHGSPPWPQWHNSIPFRHPAGKLRPYRAGFRVD